MRRKYLLRSLGLVPLVFAYTILSSYQDGPPPGRTGAPGELTCYNGYCHSSYALNSGPGQMALEANIPPTGYVPGTTYELRPKLAHSGQKRFGFMVLAYSADANASLGIWELPEPDRTQLKSNDEGTRSYATHDTAWASTDSATWLLKWQAPDTLAGPVHFYLAGVAANYDSKRSEDYVYTFNQAFEADSLRTPMEARLSGQHLRFWLGPDRRTLQLGHTLNLPLRLELFTLSGQSLGQYVWQANQSQLRLQKALPRGLLVIHYRSQTQQAAQKIWIP